MAYRRNFFNNNIYLPIKRNPRKALGFAVGAALGLPYWYFFSLLGVAGIGGPLLIPVWMLAFGALGYQLGKRASQITSKNPQSPFYTDPFYIDFSHEEHKIFDHMQFNYGADWDVMWGNFTAACETIKPTYESEIEILREGLFHKLLRINANANDIKAISLELLAVNKMKHIDDRFEEIARICDLLLFRHDYDYGGGGGGGGDFTAQAALGMSQAQAQRGPGASQQARAQSKSWEPTPEQWQKMHDAAQIKSFYNWLARLLNRFFATDDEKGTYRKQQYRAERPPKFTEVGKFVIVEHNNPYAILGVSQNASDEEIKKAYRKVMLQWHPDRNQGNPLAAQKTQEINRAKEFLGDPDKRSEVDSLLDSSATATGYGLAGSYTSGFSYAGGGVDASSSAQTHAHTNQRGQAYAQPC